MNIVLRWAVVILVLVGLLAGVHTVVDSNFVAFLIVVLVYSLTLPYTRRFIYGPPPEEPQIDPRD